jgi:hypothetical protein
MIVDMKVGCRFATVTVVIAELPAWVKSPAYVAVTDTVPLAVPVRPSFNWQPDVIRIQLAAERVPAAPLAEKLTLPVGSVPPWPPASLTCTIHVEVWPTAIVLGRQTRLVEVVLVPAKVPQVQVSPSPTADEVPPKRTI